MRTRQFTHQLFLQCLLSLGLLVLSFGLGCLPTAHAADITSATDFAPWTKGFREPGILTRNKYGYMVDSNDVINEGIKANGPTLNFWVLAHINWTSSESTKYYLLLKTGTTFKVQPLAASQVTRTKMAEYSRTALWNVAVDMSGISADQVQLVCFDDSSQYGFWPTNGVGDDETYPYTLISPVIGWNNLAPTLPKWGTQTYAGQTINFTLNAPDFRTSNGTLKNAFTFDNPVFVPNLADQKVVNNVLQSTYKVTTDLSQAEQPALVPQNDTLFGRQTTVKYQLPSSPTTQTFQYGGLKNLTVTSTDIAQTSITTKDNLAPDFITQVTNDLGNELTYRWFYATSQAPTFKEIGSDYPDSQNSTGTFNQDWLTFPKNSQFLSFAAKQNQQGQQVYLLMKIYRGDSLVALTNPISVQVTAPVLQVPTQINFGTLGVTKLYGGGQLTSQSTATDQLSVNTTGNWQVTATLGAETTNSIRKLNGWLSFGNGQSLTPTQTVVVASGTGTKTVPLAAKLNLKGYHHPLPTNRDFSETINWDLTAQPTLSATE